MIGIGAFFIAIGLAALGWDRMEKKAYDDYLSKLEDAREFLTHWPERPQFQGLPTGGWIAVTVGTLLIITGVVLLFSG